MVDTDPELKARVLAFASQVLDYDEVIRRADHLRIPAYIGRYLTSSPAGPALAYFLAKRLQLLKKILTLPANDAVEELARIEAMLGNAWAGSLEEWVCHRTTLNEWELPTGARGN